MRIGHWFSVTFSRGSVAVVHSRDRRQNCELWSPINSLVFAADAHTTESVQPPHLAAHLLEVCAFLFPHQKGQHLPSLRERKLVVSDAVWCALSVGPRMGCSKTTMSREHPATIAPAIWIEQGLKMMSRWSTRRRPTGPPLQISEMHAGCVCGHRMVCNECARVVWCKVRGARGLGCAMVH